MSRQTQLPPRYPFQKKTVPRAPEPVSPASHKDTGSQPIHCKSRSQSLTMGEHPSWFDDLLIDSDSDSSSAVHRRSASDSSTLLGGCVKLIGLNHLDERGTSLSSGSDSGLESNCTYGPNSPRIKGKLTFSDNVLASALSNFASQGPLQYVDGSFHAFESAQLDRLDHICGTTEKTNNETKSTKQHPGQRSRVRKLQYIAELEKTVSILQGFESELAVKVADLLQQRLTLSVENSRLKQQLIGLERQKLLTDGQFKSLRKEAERLKALLGHASSHKEKKSNLPGLAGTQLNWQMLNLGKLDLN